MGHFLKYESSRSQHVPVSSSPVSDINQCAIMCLTQTSYCAAYQIEVMTSSISCQLLTTGDDHLLSTVSSPNVTLYMYINQIPYYVNW